MEGKVNPATYAIQSWLGGPVKIGKADDIEKRRLDLQTGSPVPLRLMASTRDIEELSAHAHCADHRLWGEWFFPSRQLVEYVSQWSHVYAEIKAEAYSWDWHRRWWSDGDLRINTCILPDFNKDSILNNWPRQMR